MSLRALCATRIPVLTPVTFVTDAQLAENVNRGVLHRFVCACDVAWGCWGGPEPVTTISSRTAMTLMDAQMHLVGRTQGAPMWALLLGAALEIIDHGHLQGAMVADVSRQVGGLKYLTGTRVLAPMEK